MALKDCFPGSKSLVQKCGSFFCLIINPKIKSRPNAKLDGTAFKVDVDGAKKDVTLTGELCFTLVFDDQSSHTVTVTHEQSGFTGQASGAAGDPGSPPSKDVELSKPWDLVVLVKESWPGSKEQAFEKAKVNVGSKAETAGKDGKIESKGRKCGETCKLALDVKGLDDTKCQVTVETQLPDSSDGFLDKVDATKDAHKGQKAIEIPGDQPGATVTVTYVMEVSVIKPKIEAAPIALVDLADKDHPTSLSEMTLSLADTTHPSNDLAEVEAALNFDDKIKCYTDDKATKEHASKTPIAFKDLPAKLYVMGQKGGECKPTLELTTKRDEADRSWRIDPKETKVEGKIWVEKLEVEVWEHREGEDGDGKVTSAPKTRELHNQNSTNDFTGARLDIKEPSDEFWQAGGSLTLTPTSNVSLFKDAKLTQSAPTELKKTDFSSSSYRLWVKGTGNAGVEATNVSKVGSFSWTNNSTWERTPEKDKDGQHVACGAKVNSKDLHNGDGVKLETYAFDVYLDRKTSNECRTKLHGRTSDVTLTTKDVALAFAGAHKCYTKQSAAHVNKNYTFTGHNSIFGAFLGSMNFNGNVNSWSNAATNWVKNHLQTHSITLHATMFGMIQDYIKRVLNLGVNTSPYGFDVTRGVPGVHAEVLAVNEILNAINGIRPEDITVATYRLQNSMGGQGLRFVACTNCSGILLGGTTRVRVITG